MRRFCVVLLLALWAGTAWSNSSGGLAAFQTGDYAGALRQWRPAAAAGDAAENATVVGELLGDLVERGLDFTQPRLYVLDGGKALTAAVKKTCRRVGDDPTLSGSQAEECAGSSDR